VFDSTDQPQAEPHAIALPVEFQQQRAARATTPPPEIVQQHGNLIAG
jgi:hypothetical protein